MMLMRDVRVFERARERVCMCNKEKRIEKFYIKN